MNDLMLQVLIIAIVANVVLVVVAVIRSRMLRPRPGLAVASATMASSDALAASTTTSAVPAPPTEPTTDQLPTAPPDVDVTLIGEEPEMSANADDTIRPRRFAMPDEDDYPSDASVHAFLASGPRAGGSTPDGSTPDLYDHESGVRSALAWDEALGHEDARRARYGHPVTLVVAELDRLDALARQLGRENADRLIRPVAQALLVNARAADFVARLGHHRFGVILPETDEIRAINYVERVRLACDAWLDAAAVSVRLSIGWASAPSGGDLPAAFTIAERRMYADRSTARAASGESAAPEEATPAEPPAPAPAEAEPDQPGEIPAVYPGWGGPTPDLGAG